jgi:hypothetical protein
MTNRSIAVAGTLFKRALLTRPIITPRPKNIRAYITHVTLTESSYEIWRCCSIALHRFFEEIG